MLDRCDNSIKTFGKRPVRIPVTGIENRGAESIERAHQVIFFRPLGTETRINGNFRLAWLRMVFNLIQTTLPRQYAEGKFQARQFRQQAKIFQVDAGNLFLLLPLFSSFINVGRPGFTAD